MTKDRTQAFAFICLLVVFAIVAALPDIGAAQLPPEPNRIGIYTSDFQREYTGSEDRVTVYVVFSNLSRGGLIGWGAKVTQSGQGILLYVLSHEGVNVRSWPEFLVGFSRPMRQAGPNGEFVVAVLTCYVTSNELSQLSIGPIGPSSDITPPPGAFYIDPDDVVIAHSCYTPSGAYSGPVFDFNAHLVPAESASWSAVKALYR